MNISHTPSSLYDAYDVNITDFIEGMDVIRKNEFPGIEIFAPADNVYKFSAIIPVISGTVIFHVVLILIFISTSSFSFHDFLRFPLLLFELLCLTGIC